MHISILFLSHLDDDSTKKLFHPHFKNLHLQQKEAAFEINWMTSGDGIEKVWGWGDTQLLGNSPYLPSTADIY